MSLVHLFPCMHVSLLGVVVFGAALSSSDACVDRRLAKAPGAELTLTNTCLSGSVFPGQRPAVGSWFGVAHLAGLLCAVC